MKKRFMITMKKETHQGLRLLAGMRGCESGDCIAAFLRLLKLVDAMQDCDFKTTFNGHLDTAFFNATRSKGGWIGEDKVESIADLEKRIRDAK